MVEALGLELERAERAEVTKSEIEVALRPKLEALLAKCVASEAASEAAGKGLWAMPDERRRLTIMAVRAPCCV